MGCDNYLVSNMEIKLGDEEKARLAIARYNAEFPASETLPLHTNGKGAICIDIDEECYDSFFSFLEKVHAWFQREFGVGFSGYFINDTGNQRFRGEMNEHGSIIFTDIDWLLTYPIRDILRLKEYAEANIPAEQVNSDEAV